MPQYTLYSKSTGRITSLIICPSDDLGHYQLADTACIEGHVTAPDMRIVGGRAVPLPARPSEHHEFNYTTLAWVDPRTPETQWPVVRAERDKLLKACDWTQLPDVPLATKEAWAVYRQALRDITNQPDPFGLVWPVAPG